MRDWSEIPTLRGEFVLLRPTVLSDAAGLARAHDDPETLRYFPYGIESAPPSAETVSHALESGRQTLTIVDARGAEVIGTTSIYNMSEHHRRVTVGYTWLSAGVRGSACNPESKLLVLDHVFGTLRAARAEFNVDDLNTRSRRAVLAIGATEEGSLRRHARRRDGSWRTTIVYSIVDSEWPVVRERLADLVRRRSEPTGRVPAAAPGTDRFSKQETA
ncbi:GNAT family N-acetyltransferase [Nocardia sp. 2]|uniref:GNAT family N-acetyltransferase n=1 Tax=Nocardia acididurans TaxID=2802282 RepID=A0ABS1MCH0_9NOCA|nr:GNAT family protein [Nocardia acididurans]MBL1078317.1 GNAT family N-acetyltransferase [Nocardia acididurans]